MQDYVRQKRLIPSDPPPGRMIAMAGDAELDEGNVYEALLEGWKHDVRNVWWVIDYNRQSLDHVVEDRLFHRIDSTFRSVGWDVVSLKYGKRLREVFERPGGEALRDWIDNCPNSLYSALVYRGGPGWRARLKRDLGTTRGIPALLDEHDDHALNALMTNLAGQDMESVLEAFHGVESDAPTCFIAYTIKGYGLPFAGHKDNHAGLMSPDQMEIYRRAEGIAPGEEYDPFAGLDIPAEELRRFLADVPFARQSRRQHEPPRVQVPEAPAVPPGQRMSTQEGFGRLLNEIAQDPGAYADRLVTTSPDVTVSTNLGPWVNRRGLFDRRDRADSFREESIASTQKWEMSPAGQHIELGIAENNLFLLLAALGLAGPLFGARLLPIGTLYDPFIGRGLDALNYACYQGARFLLVATPSGLSLAPEGGAHQSVITPLIGLGQPGLTAFEPAIHRRAGRDPGLEPAPCPGRRRRVGLPPALDPVDRATKREMTPELRAAVVRGGYWLIPPGPGASLAVVCTGVIAPEAIEAHARIREDIPGAGLLVVTSAGRLHADWLAAARARIDGNPTARSHVERLLSALAPGAALVTVLDGHPATLTWLGAVAQQRVVALGVDQLRPIGGHPGLCITNTASTFRRSSPRPPACLDRAGGQG